MNYYAPHFSQSELVFSQTAVRTGIDNDIPERLEPNLIRLSWWLETLREILGKPIIVSSGYRSPELNARIGGSKSSAHMQGLAADINVSGMAPFDLANLIVSEMGDTGYDQVIHEFGRWVHVGLSDSVMRLEALTAMTENGKTIYKHGIIEV